MNTHELRSIAADLDGDRAPQDVPLADVISALSDGERAVKRVAAGVLSEVAARQASLLEEYATNIAAAMTSEDPLVREPVMRAFAATAEARPSVVPPQDDVVSAGLTASDPAVRVPASRALAALARSDAEAIVANGAAWYKALESATEDSVPSVRMNTLQTWAEAAEADPDRATTVVKQAGSALHAGDSEVRYSALHFFTTLSSERPDAVAPHLDSVGSLLSDPYGPHRGLAAAVIGNAGFEEASRVTPYVEDLADLLADPDPTAQQNASNALLALALETPAPVANAGAGEHIRELLVRDVVRVQENGLHLAAVLVDHNPRCIADPASVKKAAADLRSDPVLEVESHVFDRIETALDQVDTPEPVSTSRNDVGDSGGDAEATAEQDPVAGKETKMSDATPASSSGSNSGPADTASTPESSSQHDESDEYRTEVFGEGGSAGRSEATSGSTDGAVSGTDVSFCPECGEDLTDYDAPTFCPACGWSLGE